MVHLLGFYYKNREEISDSHARLSTLEEFREMPENHPLCPFCTVHPSIQWVRKRCLYASNAKLLSVLGLQFRLTYWLYSGISSVCLRKFSLALSQCVKFPSSPLTTLLTYETFFNYFSAFLLYHSALKKTAADRARIALKRYRLTQFSEAEA
jgi:hypothetical protein